MLSILLVVVLVILYVFPYFIGINTYGFYNPSPEILGKTIIDRTGVILVSIFNSYANILIATLLSLIVGIIVLYFVIRFRTIEKVLYPILISLKNIPVSTLYPISILFIGIGTKLSVFFLFVAMSFNIIPYLLNLYNGIPAELLDTGKTSGMNMRQLIMFVIFPYIKPDLILGILLNIGLGWNFILVAELVNDGSGIGYLLNASAMRGRIPIVYIGIIYIFIINYIVDRIGKSAIQKRFKWKYLGKV